MFQRGRYELKAIAFELGAQPVGDCRKIRTWELAIERAAESMDISIEAVYCPILRELQLAAKNLNGIETVQRLIEPAAENIPGVETVQEPIGKNLPVLQTVSSASGKNPPVLETVSSAKNLNGIETVQGLIEPAAENIPGVETGVTLSDKFLARYFFPFQAKIHYKADADGQLSLLDFEVESMDEPPDSDDFESLDAFREAIALWDSKHCEPIEQFTEDFSGVGTVETVLLESMCYWAPCDQLLLSAPAVELAKDKEFAVRCPCGVVLAVQCDGVMAIHLFEDRIYIVPCHRNFFRSLTVARSPPGGDVMA